MDKKTKITSLTTAALATLLLASANLSSNVKADTVKDTNASSTQKAQSPKENVQANINSAQTEVDQAQSKVDEAGKNLASAKQDAQAPDKAYADQAAQIKKAKTDFNNKQDAQAKAQNQVNNAKKLVAQATKENIAAATKAVEDKNSEISNKQQDLENTQAQEPAKQSAVDKANNDVKTAQSNLDGKNAAEKKAETTVKNAKDALNNTGINEINESIATYQKNIKNLNNNISANQDILEHNQDILKDNQTKLADITDSQLPKATQNQKDAQQAADKAKADLKTAQDKLKQDQVIANSAAGFFKSLAEDTNLTEEQREDARMAYSVVMNEGKYQDLKGNKITLQWYKDGVHLGQDEDATSLEQMKYALNDLDDLVKVRQEYGLSLPKISLTATAIAMMSSDFNRMRIIKEGSGWNLQHPIDMVKQYGPFFATEENIANGKADGSERRIEQVSQYMIEKGEYIDKYIESHPEAEKYRYDVKPLTQEKWSQNTKFWNSVGMENDIGHYTSMINPAQNSIGAATAEQYNNQGTFYSLGSMDMLQGFIPTTNEYVHQYSSFSISDYKNLVNSYNPAKTTFIKKDESNVKEKQSDVDNTKKALDTANTNITKLQSSIDAFNTAISNTREAISEAKTTITSDQKEVLQQQSKLREANDRLDMLTASNDAKVKNWKAAVAKQNEAQQAVEDAKAQLTNATKELEKAQKAKSDLEKEIVNKQDAITQAKDELKDLTAKRDALINAPQTLKTAKDNLDTAKKAVDTAKATLKTNQNKLKDLQKPKDEADAKVKAAQDAYDAADAELNDAQNKLTQAQNALAKIERQEQEAAELAAQEAQAQAESAKKAEELKQAATETKFIKLTHNAYVYDKDGNAIQVNGQNKKLLKGDSINAYSNAKIVTINGKDFYQIGENEFVKVANTAAKKISVPKSAKLTHNAFVYNKNGKRVKLTLLKRGTVIKPTKLVTIKGKKYYQISKNKFVKVANTKVKTRSIKKTATIKAKLNHKVATVDRSGKKNGHHVLGGRTYNFNEKRTVDGKTYYKIVGKNDWVPAKKLNLKK